MSLDRLIVFAAVANHRSVSHASEELHISQPAVSKQIKLLEEQYDTKFFIRGGRGVALTQRGEAFLRDVRVLVKRYEQLKEKHGAVGVKAPTQVLTVAGSYSPSTSLLPGLLARFKKSHPSIQIDLRTGNRLEVEGLILKKEVELAVINNPPLNSHLTMEPFRSEALVAFVTPDHPLARKKHLAPEDVGRVGLIIRRHKGGRAAVYDYVKYLRKAGLNPNVIMRCDTPAAVKEAVRGKLGVGILYREVVADNIGRHEFQAIKMPGNAPEGKSYIIYRKNRPLSPAAQMFLELLRREKSKN